MLCKCLFSTDTFAYGPIVLETLINCNFYSITTISYQVLLVDGWNFVVFLLLLIIAAIIIESIIVILTVIIAIVIIIITLHWPFVTQA